MRGASLPTYELLALEWVTFVLIPDEWGKSSDAGCLLADLVVSVLIPDEWGKSSDLNYARIPA